MITKEQAIKLGENVGTEIHHGQCTMSIGIRGGKRRKIVRYRSNGKCKTWATKPNAFELPLKYGFSGYAYLNDLNAKEFHLTDDCPIKE